MAEAPPNAVHPLTRAEWRAWLADHHESTTGVWLVFFKKATGKPRVEYDDAVEEALCVGWIDSKPNKLDAERSLLWFAPRKAGTGWSRPNKERVQRLIDLGAMAAAGLKKVDAAKADGSWNALDEVEQLRVPDDLKLALGRYPHAAVHFAAFPRSAQRGMLEWISTAKRPETRAQRVEKTARLASTNQRANQWRKPL
jgi:uncharacterized protein YdeI (YjbR/CyaY-like superfamily)